MRDKQRGMMFGMAVGDALGVPVEFKARFTFKPVTEYRTGTHGQEPGTFSDDTAMAVALGISLQNGFNLHDQMAHYARWRKGDPTYNPAGCFDIGGQTSGAISRWEANRVLQQAGSESCGNGSIMRLAPVVAHYLPLTVSFRNKGWEALADFCGLSSVTTHGNRRCVSACRLLGLVMAYLAYDEDVVRDPSHPCPHIEAFVLDRDCDPLIAKLWTERTYLQKDVRSVSSSGYVLHTLEAALWAFDTTDNFRDCVLAAANLGNDSDTVGAVAGMIAGAYYGYQGIPQDLIDGLRGKDCLEAAIGEAF